MTRYTAVACRAALGLAAAAAVAQGRPATADPSSTPPPSAAPAPVTLQGRIVDASRRPVARAIVRVDAALQTTGPDGAFAFRLAPGDHRVHVEADAYAPLDLVLPVLADKDLTFSLQPSSAVTVRPGTDVLAPDPSSRSYAREDLLDANPGRPGIPVSVPGVPVETASGGIKAPQYFAPGVAGDHGEPIAQYFDVAGFPFPNNLSANAHGNGYADPNVLVPAVVGGVTADAGAYNARYGDHAIFLAVDYGLRPRLGTFLQVTGDARDGDVVAGWSPRNPDTNAWVALEGSFGNGFLARPEARQQYKINALRSWKSGAHTVTLFGIAYYGFSRVPGLIPTAVPVPGDTIDPRQLDLTHTTLAVATDRWQLSGTQQVQFSGYVRTYSLDLQSDFGDGLIRQSEFRTVAGGSATYLWSPKTAFSFLAGLDLRRDAPRSLDLGRADATGVFHPVTSNDLTIGSAAPFVAVDDRITRWLRFYAGLRRDQIRFVNVDRLGPTNSFTAWPGITEPKATLTLGSENARYLPTLAVGFADAFHVNDPRIGQGQGRGSLIVRSRAWQMVAAKTVHANELRLTLSRVTSSAELAKIDPDTGLQENVGPSLVRALTVAVRRRHALGFYEVSFSKADAQDRLLHQPVPEAPRLIWDALGTLDRLPLALHARGEFEYVGRKPLGDGFTAVPVREFRANLVRNFGDGRVTAGLYGLLARGYTGQTLEPLALPGEGAPFERAVGVPLRSYAGLALTYRFRP